MGIRHRLTVAIFDREVGRRFKCKMQNAECKMEVIRDVYTGLNGGGPTFAGPAADRTAGGNAVSVLPSPRSLCLAAAHAHYAILSHT
jgi:hypothetical protein